jgi:hypothetical protein
MDIISVASSHPMPFRISELLNQPRTYCAPNAETGGAENYVLAAANLRAHG